MGGYKVFFCKKWEESLNPQEFCFIQQSSFFPLKFLLRSEKKRPKSRNVLHEGDHGKIFFNLVYQNSRFHFILIYSDFFSRHFKIQQQLRIKNGSCLHFQRRKKRRENIELQTTDLEATIVKPPIFLPSQNRTMTPWLAVWFFLNKIFLNIF